jgi:hypothetical protein
MFNPSDCYIPPLEDLVPLPPIEWLDSDDIESVIGLDWWEDEYGLLFADYSYMPEYLLSLSEGEDYRPTPPVSYISHALKRWSEEDGWYHA